MWQSFMLSRNLLNFELKWLFYFHLMKVFNYASHNLDYVIRSRITFASWIIYQKLDLLKGFAIIDSFSCLYGFYD